MRSSPFYYELKVLYYCLFASPLFLANKGIGAHTHTPTHPHIHTYICNACIICGLSYKSLHPFTFHIDHSYCLYLRLHALRNHLNELFTLCAICFKTKNLTLPHALHLCVLYNFHNQQRLYP